MKHNNIIYASVLSLAAIFPLVKAWPASSPYGYSAYSNPLLGSVKFPCGDNVLNWVVDVGIGSPEQVAPLLISTTFDETFVAGVMCHSDFCTKQQAHLFDAGKSSSIYNLNERVTFDLGDGEIVKSDLYSDKFTIGDYKADNLTFGKAFEVTGFPSSANYAGVLGLGASASDATTTKSSFTKRAGSFQGNAEFGMNHGRRPNSRRKRNNDGQCELTFGIDNSVISGDIAWLDLPTCEFGKSPFWKTDLTCVTIGDTIDLKFTNTVAAFDTTVKHIEVPHSDIQKIHEGLNATYNSGIDAYEFKCCNAKDLKISFQKYTTTIPVSAWTTQIDYSGELCTAKISISNTTVEPVSRWRLGTDFLINFYSIYSLKRQQTGLALVKFGNEGVHITPR